MKGCNKVLYENDEGKVYCGNYMSGGIMLCLECQSSHNPSSEKYPKIKEYMGVSQSQNKENQDGI